MYNFKILEYLNTIFHTPVNLNVLLLLCSENVT